jgi:hypothetical protein
MRIVSLVMMMQIKTPNSVRQTTSGPRNCVVHLLTAIRLYSNSPPEVLKNQGQSNPTLNDYNSDRKGIRGTSWIPDMTDWWRIQEEIQSMYVDLSNVVSDIYSIIPHGIGL